MAELSLQSLLPRGTITYSTKNVGSTIDLIFTTTQLGEDMSFCKIYECNHGSDHEAIHTRFSASLLPLQPTPRLLFKNAPWAKICEHISLNTFKISASPDEIDSYTHQIMSVVTEAIDQHVLKAKTFSYSKRWWTEDLSVLRKNYARLRNQTRRRRRNGEDYLLRLDT